MNFVPLMFSFEARFSFSRAAYVSERSAWFVAVGARKRPLVTSAGVTSPMSGCDGSTPPIE